MKILLSAYACEPNKGSEPGVGWHWALALRRRGFNVHVLTRSNNRVAIETVLPQGSDLNLTFHYYDLPTWSRFWKHWPAGIYLYYLLWQMGASRFAKRLHGKERFDRVQHITFVSFRQPSFMGELGIPFIFGPVGGGEKMPARLRASLPLSARIAEAVRSAGNRFAALDPMMRRTYKRAQRIVCATEETKAAIPAQFQYKCIVQRAIGIEPLDEAASLKVATPNRMSGAQHHFLFVARLLYWKGLHLALRALAFVRESVPNATLRVIGEGRERSWLEQIARQAGVADCVEWIQRKPQNEIYGEYQESTALVFPSLHDSGGMVVIEAMAVGLPIICLDLGGPGSIVSPEVGFSLPARGLDEETIVRQIASAMIRLAQNPDLRRRLSEAAMRQARELSWDAAAEGVYGPRPNRVAPAENGRPGAEAVPSAVD